MPFAVYTEKDNTVSHTILKLKYASEAKHSPDLAQTLNRFGHSVHLYQSHIDTIQNHLVGTLIVGVADLEIDLLQLTQQLKNQIAHIEVLGYARPTH